MKMELKQLCLEISFNLLDKEKRKIFKVSPEVLSFNEFNSSLMPLSPLLRGLSASPKWNFDFIYILYRLLLTVIPVTYESEITYSC